MEIIIHRGTHQIGGCVTEIKSSKGTRIFIDIGENLPSLEEPKPEIQVPGLFSEPRECDAIFITHYHGDHVGMLNRVLDGIPVYMGDISFKVFEYLTNRVDKAFGNKAKDIAKFKDIQTFVAGDKISINDIIVTPYRVDHSAYDAYMFLIECDGKKILHTGDFRTHGWIGKGVNLVAKKLIRKVDIIITEGTMVSRMTEDTVIEDIMTEKDLYEKFKDFLKTNNIFVMCSSTNIDTIAGLYMATQELGKLFVSDGYQRAVLDIVTKDPNPKKHEMYNFHKVKKYWVDKKGIPRQDTIDKMKAMGFCCLVRANDYDMFPNLIKSFPDAKVIYSVWDGYLHKDKPYRNESYIKMVDQFNALTDNWHTSGHATFKAIQELCTILGPTYIIPIHTEKPKKFKEINGAKIVLLEDKEPFCL